MSEFGRCVLRCERDRAARRAECQPDTSHCGPQDFGCAEEAFEGQCPSSDPRLCRHYCAAQEPGKYVPETEYDVDE